jgi:hypothetical protein
MATSSTTHELRESLQRHNAAFETLVNLIPAQYYIGRDVLEVARLSDHNHSASQFSLG